METRQILVYLASLSLVASDSSFMVKMASGTTADAAAKVYTCPTCAREFNKKANLKVHSRKHTGEKPYACSRRGCDRRFMWKSSVSFHEQNCVAGGRDDSGAPSVPKRPKMIHAGRDNTMIPTTPTTPGESPPRPHVTNVQNPSAMPQPSTANMPGVQFFNANNGFMRHSAQTAAELVNTSFQQHLMRLTSASLQSHGMSSMSHPGTTVAHFSIGNYPGASLSGTNLGNGPLRAGAFTRNNAVTVPQSSAMFGGAPFEAAVEMTHKLSSVSQPLPQAGFASQLAIDTKPPLPPSHPTEANPLPAPSTILDKPAPVHSACRPPVPPPLQKPSFGSKPIVEGPEPFGTGGVKESMIQPSAAKPPVMHGPKNFKMPISMDLDESDEEGAVLGAQELFIRTGNILGGFAPPPRCSPLPASSPIVGLGVTPMPLSPLAPFSPLPPDSPAHNAPAPVHPPLNQPQRSTNANF